MLCFIFPNILRRGIENSEQFENLLSERTAVRSAVQYKYYRKLGMDSSWNENTNTFVTIVSSVNVMGIINWLSIYGKLLHGLSAASVFRNTIVVRMFCDAVFTLQTECFGCVFISDILLLTE